MKDKVIIAAEISVDSKMQIRINTTNEAVLSLALMVMESKTHELIGSVVVKETDIQCSVIIAALFDDFDNIVCEINTVNKGLVALALRKAIQAVDFYLEEMEVKKALSDKKLVQVIEQNKISVPSGIITKLRG